MRDKSEEKSRESRLPAKTTRQVDLCHNTSSSSPSFTRDSKPHAWIGIGIPRTEGAKISNLKGGFPVEESSSF